jgi:hypothetical protein
VQILSCVVTKQIWVPFFGLTTNHIRRKSNIDLRWFVPVVPHKAVAEVSKIGNL